MIAGEAQYAKITTQKNSPNVKVVYQERVFGETDVNVKP